MKDKLIECELAGHNVQKEKGRVVCEKCGTIKERSILGKIKWDLIEWKELYYNLSIEEKRIVVLTSGLSILPLMGIVFLIMTLILERINRPDKLSFLMKRTLGTVTIIVTIIYLWLIL